MTDIAVEFKVYRPIIWKLADSICQSISRSAIRSLQKMDASGVLGDYGMKTVWEELCILIVDAGSILTI